MPLVPRLITCPVLDLSEQSIFLWGLCGAQQSCCLQKGTGIFQPGLSPVLWSIATQQAVLYYLRHSLKMSLEGHRCDNYGPRSKDNDGFVLKVGLVRDPWQQACFVAPCPGGSDSRGDSLPTAPVAGVFGSRETFCHPSRCFPVRPEQAGRWENIGSL